MPRDGKPLSTEEQILDCLRALIRVLRELASSGPRRGPGELLTAEELAERFQLSARTIKDQAAAGLLPHHRFGKHYRFSEDDIAEVLRLTKQEPRARTRRGRVSRIA